MQVKIKKLSKAIDVPRYATYGSACFDLQAREDTEIKFREIKKVPLGIAFEIPKNHVMLIFPRSSMGAKTYVRMANSVGVIDSDYRGEVCAIYENISVPVHHIRKGERIVQGLILPVERVTFEVVEELTETERGKGGFGSTGKL